MTAGKFYKQHGINLNIPGGAPENAINQDNRRSCAHWH